MTGPAPAVAAVRNAVRAALADLEPGALVLVACSGGADSLALAAALAFVAPRMSSKRGMPSKQGMPGKQDTPGDSGTLSELGMVSKQGGGLRAGGVTIDHGLQEGSSDRAGVVAGKLAALGLDPVHAVAVTVGADGGPEAAAREARYGAIDKVAAQAGAAAVLLGHTLDDQAETVLLGLARGSGARSLAGMPARRGIYRRPLLGIRRAQTAAACAELGLAPWHDPHNADRRFARVRVRLDALPALEAALGPGVTEALARTAVQLRADGEAMDFFLKERPAASSPLSVAALAGLPGAVRGRLLRSAALTAGCPAGALGAGHVRRLDELVTRWHGQRWVDLPGGVRAVRKAGDIWFSGAGTSPGTEGRSTSLGLHSEGVAHGRQ